MILRLNEKRGITLIVLVITIIILLILASTSIQMFLGDNGILKKVINAKELTKEAENEEKEKLNIFVDLVENLGNDKKVEKIVYDTDISGNLSTGDKVSFITKDKEGNIENEQIFYVIKTDSKETLLFAAYNLNVGDNIDSSVDEGIQGKTVRAWVNASTPSYGATKYYDTQKEPSSGTSILDGYLSNYKKYMENTYNISLSDISLLKRSDAIENLQMSNSTSTSTAFNPTSKYYEWMAYTTFWFEVEDSNASGYIYYLNSQNRISSAYDVSGIRPTITVPTSLITRNNTSESINTGTKVSLKNNQTFYVVKSNNTDTLLLAAYNLNVGQYKNDNVSTGIQDPTIRAWYSDDNSATNYGRTKYYDIEGNYSSGTSILDGYLDFYKSYLEENNNINITSIGLLNRNDAIKYLGLIATKGSPAVANDSPYKDWLPYTTFWFESEGSSYVYFLNAQNVVGTARDVSGIRPVITVKTNIIKQFISK